MVAHRIEPITLLGALASVTEHIGLVATATTTYLEPFHVARMFASLDQLSGGRSGWNLVTSSAATEALNFSHAAHAAARRPLRARRRIRPGDAGPVGHLRGRRLRAGQDVGAVLRPGEAAHAQPQGQALPGARAADDAPLAAGPAGDRARRPVRGRPHACARNRRGGVLGRAGHREGARVLQRPEEPRGAIWAAARIDPDHAGRARGGRRAAKTEAEDKLRAAAIADPSRAWRRDAVRHAGNSTSHRIRSTGRCRMCR